MRYANCETDRHTDTFIAIIHSPLRGKLVTKYSVGMLFMTKKNNNIVRTQSPKFAHKEPVC